MKQVEGLSQKSILRKAKKEFLENCWLVIFSLFFLVEWEVCRGRLICFQSLGRSSWLGDGYRAFNGKWEAWGGKNLGRTEAKDFCSIQREFTSENQKTASKLARKLSCYVNRDNSKLIWEEDADDKEQGLWFSIWDPIHINKAMKRKKKGESTKPSTGKVLTEWYHVPIIFQHHIFIEVPLSVGQTLPLLMTEVHSYILKCHWLLK